MCSRLLTFSMYAWWKLNRFKETPHSGPLCDLLWCDPSDKFDEEQPDFKPNDVRDCAYFFSYYTCRDFSLRNKLLSIIRGHEVQKDGVGLFRKSARTNFPVIVSIICYENDKINKMFFLLNQRFLSYYRISICWTIYSLLYNSSSSFCF